MMRISHCGNLLACLAFAIPASAQAQDEDSRQEADAFDLKPSVSLRLRQESADQAGFPNSASALTARARAGAEASYRGWSLLAEAEGTLALSDKYNDTLPRNDVEPFPVIADPESFELNRLQLAYRADDFQLTIGRQRIIHDDARFLGNVGWRQNEQTFDAVRAQGIVGSVALDASYAISQRTIFGSRSPNSSFDGDFVLLRGEVELGPIELTAFSYLLDYEDRIAFSSQTFGLSASGHIPLGPVKLSGTARYAAQADAGDSPVDYQADYIEFELAAGFGNGTTFKAGYEELGSDNGVASFQTPLATLHAFNGFADQFLMTPPEGLRDTYLGVSQRFAWSEIPGLRANLTYHSFHSGEGDIDYGSEWNAVLSAPIGDVKVLAKYANYRAAGFGRDTERFWLQAEISF